MTEPDSNPIGWVIWPAGAGYKQVGLYFNGGPAEGPASVIFELPSQEAWWLSEALESLERAQQLELQLQEAQANVERLTANVKLAARERDEARAEVDRLLLGEDDNQYFPLPQLGRKQVRRLTGER